MSQDFFVVYNLETRIPYSISGSTPARIPENNAVCLAKHQDGEDFVLFKKSMADYLVAVNEDGYADFTFKHNLALTRKYGVANNIVRDLSYRLTFILELGITFIHTGNELELTFDLSKLGPDRKNIFNTTITPGNGRCLLYITEYQNPTALLEKHNIDLYKLSKLKKKTITIKSTGKISVWASRAV
jgi:hypothetical protein